MDIPNSLSRGMLTILVPGFVAAVPWVFVAVELLGTLEVSKFGVFVPAMGFAAVVVAGSAMSAAGTQFEHMLDQLREKEYEVSKYWRLYLSTVVPIEPVGYRYLSSRATTLQYELAMAVAVPSFLFSAALITAISFGPIDEFPDPFLKWAAYGGMVVVVFLSAYSFHSYLESAKDTHRVLCERRREIVKGLLRESRRSGRGSI